MLDTIVHRGPDDSGCYVNANIGLGSRRLSIIDLETGKQPISNEDGTIWVVYNGEIYNYQALRAQLEVERTSSSALIPILRSLFICMKKSASAVWSRSAACSLLLSGMNVSRNSCWPVIGLDKNHSSTRSDGSDFFFGSEIKAILATSPSQP